jgi:Flp pilus assembly protein TadB
MLRDEATAARRDFTHALGAYFDLVVMVVAGGAGVDSALMDAAAAGEGWVFDELRRTLERARRAGDSPWASLGSLGERLAIDPLVQFAANVELAGEEGTAVRDSVLAQARSLRDWLLTDSATAANEQSERMALAVGVVFFGFLLFIGFPALDAVQNGV